MRAVVALAGAGTGICTVEAVMVGMAGIAKERVGDGGAKAVVVVVVVVMLVVRGPRLTDGMTER